MQIEGIEEAERTPVNNERLKGCLTLITLAVIALSIIGAVISWLK